MCKILTITNVKAASGVLKRFIETAMPIITKHDSHGCGYIASDGVNIFTEKWLDVGQALKQRGALPKDIEATLLQFRGAIDSSPTYACAGEVDTSFDSVKAVALHARYSTNTISLHNTHPFTALGVSLIHNGVIDNHTDWKKHLSTCDSESILTAYLKNKVNEHTSNIQVLFESLKGYYACSLMHTTLDGEVMLDVFKDKRADLSFGIVEELGNAWVWVTDFAQLEEVCAKMGWKAPMEFDFDSYVLARVNVTTGVVSEVFQGVKPVLSAVPEYLTNAWQDSYEGFRDEYKNKWEKHEVECSTETGTLDEDEEYCKWWERTQGHKNRR